MIILDTSVWIEHLKKNQIFFDKICELLESGEVLAVECIFGELLQRVKNKNELDKKLLRVLPDERKKKKEK